MRYLLLADIQANLEALQTCLKAAKKEHYDRLLVLGDIVGYGAQPNACIELLKEERHAICLQGNHDAAAVDMLKTDDFNEDARASVELTKDMLTEENKAWLSELPKFFSINFLLGIHGTPFHPLTEYMTEELAKKALEDVPEQVIACGHVQVPFYYTEKDGLVNIMRDKTIDLKQHIVVSLPSVGQPRDGDSRTGFSILDFDKKKLFVKRVEYDFEVTAKKIRTAGFPANNADRLAEGK
jgi:diadenosine tetraphosphatase ApaH/serine/threonine PP2A family protein phosphatase